MKIITVGLHLKKVRIFGAGALLEHAQSSNETFEGEWDCEGVSGSRARIHDFGDSGLFYSLQLTMTSKTLQSIQDEI